MPNKNGLLLAIALGGICLPAAMSYASSYDDISQIALRLAGDAQQQQDYSLTIDPSRLSTASSNSQVPEASGTPLLSDTPQPPVLTLDAGGVASKIHGFGDLSANTSYTTPRGLVVQSKGVSVQPLAGLVFDVYSGDGPINDVSFIVGTWMNFLSSHSSASGHNTNPAFNEIDFFPGVNVKFLNDWALSVTYDIWVSPPGNFATEENIETKLSFDDTKYLKDFALHPYVNVFYNFAGGSPVVTGKTGGSYYAEFGIGPSYTYKGITDYPITFTLPTYVSVGPSSFWSTDGSGGNIGVFSTGLQVSMPLAFIPKDYGFWKIHAGVNYYHLCNENLETAAEILGNGSGRSRYLANIGIGFGF